MTSPIWEHRCCSGARRSAQRICPRCYAIADTYAWAVPTEHQLRLRATPEGPLVSIAGPILTPEPPRPVPAVRPPGVRPHRPHEDEESPAKAESTRPEEPESPIKGVFGTAMVLIAALLIIAAVAASSPESSAVLMSVAAILMVVFLPLVTGHPPRRSGASSGHRR